MQANKKEMTVVVIERKNNFPQIMKQKGWDRKEAMRQIQFYAHLTYPTAAKWVDGDTDLDLISLERMAAWLRVSKDDLLETKVRP